jgi:hypothetical protein
MALGDTRLYDLDRPPADQLSGEELTAAKVLLMAIQLADQSLEPNARRDVLTVGPALPIRLNRFLRHVRETGQYEGDDQRGP